MNKERKEVDYTELLLALTSYIEVVDGILLTKGIDFDELIKAQNMKEGERYVKIRLKKKPKNKYTSVQQSYWASARKVEEMRSQGINVEIIEGDYPTQMKDDIRTFKVGFDALVKHTIFEHSHKFEDVVYKQQLQKVCTLLFFASGGNRDEALEHMANYFLYDVFAGNSEKAQTWCKSIAAKVRKNSSKYPKFHELCCFFFC